MSSVMFTEHQGEKVLVVDFSGSSDTNAVMQTAEEAIAFVCASNKPGSLLGLIDLSGVCFTKETQGAIKKMAAHNRPSMKFVAIVGLGGMRAIMLRLMLRIRKRTSHKLLRSRQEALDWLVKQ